MANKPIRVMLDAGHVGPRYNRSPVVPDYYESAAMWKLHQMQQEELEARGFVVDVTRPSIDADMDVYSRGAAGKGYDIILSDHSNAAGDASVDYPVVYYACDNRNNARTLALSMAKLIGETMGTRQAGREAVRKNSSGGEYYGFMRGARAAGVPIYLLLEHSFHTNAAAAAWLLQDANLRRLAVAQAELLALYYKVVTPSPAYPDWQTDALQRLADAGIIDSPEYWLGKFGQSITVGEVFGILGKVFRS